MKSLSNDLRITQTKQQQTFNNNVVKPPLLQNHKKLQQLMQANIQCQTTIKLLELQAQKLQNGNKKLDEELTKKRTQLQTVKKQLEEEQKKNQQQHDADQNDSHFNASQQQNQIKQWINHVQSFSNVAGGTKQQIIDSLLALDYQGGADQNQICLSCYKPMEIGVQCKYLPCYHLFHADCINVYLKTSKVCPACGQPVQQ